MTKKYDRAQTPHRRAERHQAVAIEDLNILADTYTDLNPAAIQRAIQTLTAQRLTLTTGKAAVAARPSATAHYARIPS